MMKQNMGNIARDTGEELVEVTLFKDSERYCDDLFVCVNGESCLIQRGVPVKVRRQFAEVIQNSARQDLFADRLMHGGEA